jgi:predicted DNA-binding protein YlxM (UPF0122 family)
MLDKLLRIGRLYDFYGALLTEKQREYLEMHYLHDLSLSEIADELGISRQAVHDNLRRAEHILEEYENSLKLVERYEKDRNDIKEALSLLSALPCNVREITLIKHSIAILNRLIDR